MNPWVKYSQGHWTREMPAEPGCYTVTSADPLLAGEDPGHRVVYIVRMPNGDLYCTEECFKGFWWSEPLPSLPPPLQKTVN
jgi:hypothetical protein